MTLLNSQERKELSKFLSLILRHRPEKGNLHLDDAGFALLSDVLTAVRRNRQWRDLPEAMVREVVATSDKQRFEITGDLIRARYGHSVPQQVTYAPIEPPEILYHGTSPGVVSAIAREGLRPMDRQYVHLSSELAQANMVGRRHSAHPVILTVCARKAAAAGIAFYQPEARLFLADRVPPEFIEFPEVTEQANGR